jgi:hypothetical protein
MAAAAAMETEEASPAVAETVARELTGYERNRHRQQQQTGRAARLSAAIAARYHADHDVIGVTYCQLARESEGRVRDAVHTRERVTVETEKEEC